MPSSTWITVSKSSNHNSFFIFPGKVSTVIDAGLWCLDLQGGAVAYAAVAARALGVKACILTGGWSNIASSKSAFSAWKPSAFSCQWSVAGSGTWGADGMWLFSHEFISMLRGGTRCLSRVSFIVTCFHKVVLLLLLLLQFRGPILT